MGCYGDRMITVTITSFEKGETHILNEPSKFEDDMVTTSSRITWEQDDGSSHGCYVKSSSKLGGVKEIIPMIQKEQFFEVKKSYKFKDINVTEPVYVNEEGESGNIKYVDEYLHEARNLHIINKDQVEDELSRAMTRLFPVKVIM